jgi:hypothetical protein
VESVWNSHTVAVPAGGGAAPRFYQVDVTGGSVEGVATQAFTYAPADTLNRFMPSVAVNRNGDMALGYNAANSTTHPLIAYAGRDATDLANTIRLTETTMVAVTGSQSGTSRWGDYSTMTLDPDGCRFWFFGEYYQVTGANWNTRVGAFEFPGCTASITGTINGTVRNSAGLPLGGATVRLGVRTTMTAANGAYSFTGLPEGTYPSATASHPGLNAMTVNTIIVPGGGAVVKDFTLSAAPKFGCFVDTTQSDFSADTATDCDLTTNPNNVQLPNVDAIDQQNSTVTINGYTFNATNWAGQTFTAGVSGMLTRVDLNLFCSGCVGTTPNLTVSIRATSAGLPTGADLATATIPGFSSGAGGYYTANLVTPLAVTAFTRYAVIFRPVSNPSVGSYAYVVSASSAYVLGDNVFDGGNSGATWGLDNTADIGFRTYVQAGFNSPGTLISSVKDGNPMVGGVAVWDIIDWTVTTPASTMVQFQVAASNSINGPFDFVGPDGTAGTFFTNGGSLAQFTGRRYLRYKAILSSSDSAVTPIVHDVTICFSSLQPGVFLNNDGLGDVFTYDAAFGDWKRQATQANGTFVEASGLWDPAWTVVPAKFNDDALTDFFLFNTTNGQWFKMINDGVSGFTPQAMETWWFGWQRFVMDIDGDGNSDVFLWDPASGVWFKAISTPTGFTYIQGFWSPDWEVTPMTLNGDALGDLFLINRTSALWCWWRTLLRTDAWSWLAYNWPSPSRCRARSGIVFGYADAARRAAFWRGCGDSVTTVAARPELAQRRNQPRRHRRRSMSRAAPCSEPRLAAHRQ